MGVSTEAANSDLNAAFAGGDTFLSRMEQLSAAKEAAEKAEAALNLGISAKAILDQSEAKMAEADRALADVRKQAQAIVTDAEKAAAATVADAEKKASSLVADAAKLRSSADENSADARKRADQLIADATRKAEQAARQLSDAVQAQSDAASALAKAEEMQAAASDAEHRFKGSLAILKTACAQVLASD